MKCEVCSVKSQQKAQPFFVVLGPSRMGKTELVKSLFENPFQVQIGDSMGFPDALRGFKRTSVKCEVCSVKWEVRSVKCEV